MSRETANDFEPFENILQKGVDSRGYIIWETEEERDQRLSEEFYYLMTLRQQAEETMETFPLEVFNETINHDSIRS